MAISKIGRLPISVVQRVCDCLDVEGSGVKNWKDLIAQPQGKYSHDRAEHREYAMDSECSGDSLNGCSLELIDITFRRTCPLSVQFFLLTLHSLL